MDSKIRVSAASYVPLVAGAAVIKVDRRGCPISGSTPAALEVYEQALALLLSWRKGAEVYLDLALRHAPKFVMAHVMQSYLVLSSRDPRKLRMVRPILARATKLPANESERLHLAAIAAALADNFELAKLQFGELLRQQPRDVLALHICHSIDYTSGNLTGMLDRVTQVLPAWTQELPGYHAVLSMHAFALEECGHYVRAESSARTALALNAWDARAYHVMAHVFEMTGRTQSGATWMIDHAAHWSGETLVATHCWWHVALFYVAQGQCEQALAVYDKHIRAVDTGELSDLIDAASLLWRIHLNRGATSDRWQKLVAAWKPFIDDHFCSFSDLHAMLVFVGARDWQLADRLERALVDAARYSTRHGLTTRSIGLPACRALRAFGLGQYERAIDLLTPVAERAPSLGGSHAQRDVLQQTLAHARHRLREAKAPMRIGPSANAASIVPGMCLPWIVTPATH
jgi:tetratricopeptide (TPR) repeat protein